MLNGRPFKSTSTTGLPRAVMALSSTGPELSYRNRWQVADQAEANADLWLTYAADYRADVGVDTLRPEQMASTLIFLGSDAASGVNGELLQVDQGHTNAALTDGYHAPLVKMLAGEMEFDISALG